MLRDPSIPYAGAQAKKIIMHKKICDIWFLSIHTYRDSDCSIYTSKIQVYACYVFQIRLGVM